MLDCTLPLKIFFSDEIETVVTYISFLFFLFIYFMYISILSACMSVDAYFISVPNRLLDSPRIGVMDDLNHHMDVGNQPQFLWENCQCL